MSRPEDTRAQPRADARPQARSKARPRAAWNLLLVLAVLVPFVTLYGALCELVSLAHAWARPGEGAPGASLGALLAFIAPLIAALPLALYIGNTLVWLHPATRRLLETAPGLSQAAYHRSQQVLARLMGVLLPLALVLTTIGVALPWR